MDTEIQSMIHRISKQAKLIKHIKDSKYIDKNHQPRITNNLNLFKFKSEIDQRLLHSIYPYMEIY